MSNNNLLSQIRVVLFDFGGILAEEGFREGLYVIARRNVVDPDAFYHRAQDEVYATGYCLGKGTEADFWSTMRRHFSIKDHDAELTQTILDHFVIRPKMLEIVGLLRAHDIVCGILSDQTDWLERLDERDRFYSYFDRIYNSYRMGKGKRDASLFDDIVADLGVTADRVIFLDDDAGNIMRARSRGLKVIQCDRVDSCLNRLEKCLGFPVVKL